MLLVNILSVIKYINAIFGMNELLIGTILVIVNLKTEQAGLRKGHSIYDHLLTIRINITYSSISYRLQEGFS